MITIPELMKILKPVKTCRLMNMSANYLAEIKEAKEDGAYTYEIRGLATRSGNPHTVWF